LLFKRGLAYQKESLQWWCPLDKTVLANEQVENGKCWRCDSVVEKKALPQWFFKITEYADRLVDDLENLNWSESIKSMQRNWIGRSRGAEIYFKIAGSKDILKVANSRGREVYKTSPDQERHRAAGNRPGKNRGFYRGLRYKPGERRKNTDLDSRLRSDGIWHRCHHGGTGA
jgi:leucyl-tRNA synthetase